jgi:four helix bundle protein
MENFYMKENIIATKSIDFAIRIIHLHKTLIEEKREYVMSKQLLRSGTSIGALVREAEHAESKPDFLHKMNIALKEANETSYWLFLFFKGEYLLESTFNQYNDECLELIKLLASIVKTTKSNLGR